jgi:hypothetical protein
MGRKFLGNSSAPVPLHDSSSQRPELCCSAELPMKSASSLDNLSLSFHRPLFSPNLIKKNTFTVSRSARLSLSEFSILSITKLSLPLFPLNFSRGGLWSTSVSSSSLENLLPIFCSSHLKPGELSLVNGLLRIFSDSRSSLLLLTGYLSPSVSTSLSF